MKLFLFMICVLIALFACDSVNGLSLTSCPEAFSVCNCRIPTVGLINIDCSRKGLDHFPEHVEGLEVRISESSHKL